MAPCRPKVGLFVTCLVDLMRQAIGFAAVKLLEDAGCEVAVPAVQTCCGQPAYNSGDSEDAAFIARQVIDAFEYFDYVVVPSGPCAGTIKLHYLEMFAGEPDMLERTYNLAVRTYQLTSLTLVILKVGSIGQRSSGIGTLPRTVKWITGSSRTGDIEQTMLLGAHGPRLLHVLLVDV